MTLFRRFLVFQAFLVWQGGFFFYAAVVVPIGTDFLQSPALQGMITQQVTHWMNLLGLVWAAVYFWDTFAVPDPERWPRRVRRWGWAACAVLLAALFALHWKLDSFIDLDRERVRERATFYIWHETYLWVCTIHWVLGLVLAALTLRAWRIADRTMPPPIPPRTDREQP